MFAGPPHCGLPMAADYARGQGLSAPEAGTQWRTADGNFFGAQRPRGMSDAVAQGKKVAAPPLRGRPTRARLAIMKKDAGRTLRERGMLPRTHEPGATKRGPHARRRRNRFCGDTIRAADETSSRRYRPAASESSTGWTKPSETARRTVRSEDSSPRPSEAASINVFIGVDAQ